MKKHFTKILAFVMVLAMLIPALTAFANDNLNTQTALGAEEKDTEEKDAKEITSMNISVPKYIFLFIGDGMSYPQMQAASYYLGANASNGGVVSQELNFMDFPVAGTAQTYDSTSFCPDSASTATALSTGYKTYSGTINMDTTKTIAYETISEKLKKQLDYKIGVISSVNLNHATPAAFYAHQASRHSYYDIGIEMIESDFDYFAGGALISSTGKNNDQTDLYQLASEAGYKVIKTQEEAEKLKAKDGKAVVIAETLADSNSISYDLDAAEDEWRLADYVEKGIEVLDGDQGFFMMVEGGKIDWACHANDAAATINDTVAFSNAVDKAIEFYNQHPSETLILVTGDHETGGMTIGFAGTNYNTYLTNLAHQKISYAKFNTDYVAEYKEKGTSFYDVLIDVKENFGLVAEYAADGTEEDTLVMTNYEYQLLENAYKMTINEDAVDTQKEYLSYGYYEPLTVTITHILNNKSGIAFSSYSHTGVPVPVFAIGDGDELFEGYYDNTDIFDNLVQITNVK